MTKRHPPASRAGLVRGGIALWLLSLTACPRAADPAPAQRGREANATPESGTATAGSPAPRPDAQIGPQDDPAPEPAPRLAASGIDPGQKLARFDAVDVESGETICPPCMLASTPGVLVAGAVDDPEFAEDLLDVQAILARHRPPVGSEGPEQPDLLVFGIVGTRGPERSLDDAGATPGLVIPTRDERDALLGAARTLRRRLELPVPLVVPEDSAAFAAAYRLDRPRTIMLVGRDGRVRHTAVDPEDLAAFDRDLTALLASAD